MKEEKKIEEKIQFELKKKEELRKNAIEYLKDFENKRIEEIEKKKKSKFKKRRRVFGK